MKTKYRLAAFWILPVLLWIMLNEQMLLKLLANLIPEAYIVRSPEEFSHPRTDPFVFGLFEIPKIIPYLFLSITAVLVSKRFRAGVAPVVFTAGLTGIVAGWVCAFWVVAEPWLTGPEISSTLLLDLIILPVNMGLLMFAAVCITLIVIILKHRTNPSLLYGSSAGSRRKSVKDGAICSLVLISAILSWFFFIYPEYEAGIAASVSTGGRKLERMLAVAEKNQNGKIIELLASNPKMSPASLVRIYDSIHHATEGSNAINIRLLKSLAWNRSTPPDVLTAISNHKNKYVFYNNLSRNPGAPKEVLSAMVENRQLFRDIRMQLAVNPNLLPESLLILAQDSDYRVRLKTAGNPVIGNDILQILCKDDNPEVREKAEQILTERCPRPE